MRMIIIALSTLIGLLLAACSAAVTPTVLAPVATATPQPTIKPLPTATSEPLPDDVLAIYHKRGCFAGLDETLIVYSDGRLEQIDRQGTIQKAQVAIEELADLQDLLVQPEFAELQPLYQAVGADLCVYTITARRSGKSFSVTTMDGAETPEFLRQVLDAAAQLRDRIRSSNRGRSIAARHALTRESSAA